MTNNDIGFYPEIQCDDCGRIGAYDVDGDYVCVYCLNASVDAETLYGEEDDYEGPDEYTEYYNY